MLSSKFSAEQVATGVEKNLKVATNHKKMKDHLLPRADTAEIILINPIHFFTGQGRCDVLTEVTKLFK